MTKPKKYTLFLDGRWQILDESQAKSTLSEEDFKHLNQWGRLDRPIEIPDGEDLSDLMHRRLLTYPLGMSYNIAVLRDGKRYLFERPTNPCLGNLTKYIKVHGGDFGCHNRQMPGDLYYAFPDGEVIGIGYNLYNPWDEIRQAIIDDSHVSEALGGGVGRTDGNRSAFVQTRMDIDPNVFWIGLKRLEYSCNNYQKAFERLVKSLSSRDALAVLAFLGLFRYGSAGMNSFRRIYEADPHRISKGTYKDGYGYTRANCEYIFCKWKLPLGCEKFYNNPVSEKYPEEGDLYPLLQKSGLKFSLDQIEGTEVLDFLIENMEKKVA